MMTMRPNAMAKGFSGVSTLVVETLANVKCESSSTDPFPGISGGASRRPCAASADIWLTRDCVQAASQLGGRSV